MIDITKAKIAFKDYIKNYDIENPKIKLKIAHIERTSQIARKIAESLNLSDEDIKLAELIGLLHDIGRFEQVRKYNTFVDHLSENHAKIGVDILFKDGLIRRFIEDDKYDKIIELAIINHNKDKNMLSKDLSPKEELHVKLIRDSDKIDILYILTYEKKETAWEKADLSDDIISEEIYKDFMEKGKIDYGKKKSSVDSLIGHFAYIFDFNFPDSIQLVKEKNYMETIYNRFEFHNQKTMEQYKNIYDKVVKYMKTLSD